MKASETVLRALLLQVQVHITLILRGKKYR